MILKSDHLHNVIIVIYMQ